MAEQSRRRVQSIEVGFRVLRVLRMAEGPLPLREIAARADMPPSKAHLYLVSLVRETMAYQEPGTGHYGLGAFAIQLGLAAVRQLDVVSLAGDALTQLRDQTDCAIYLSLWGDQGPCIVAKADGALQGAFALKLGYILPLDATASGLVYLAYLPRVETLGLLQGRFGGSASFETKLEEVRRNGYASTVGQLNQNFAAVAAPILGPTGNLAAVLTLLGPIEYVTAHRDKCVELVPAAARRVSLRLTETAA